MTLLCFVKGRRKSSNFEKVVFVDDRHFFALGVSPLVFESVFSRLTKSVNLFDLCLLIICSSASDLVRRRKA